MPTKAPSRFLPLVEVVANAISREGPGTNRAAAGRTGIVKVPLVAVALSIVVLTLWPFNFWTDNGVRPESAGGLHFLSPSVAYVERAGERLAGLEEFTLLVRYRSDDVQPVNYNTILVLERERTKRTLLLRRQKGRVVFSMQGLPYPLVAEPVDDVSEPVWLAIRSNRTECRLSLDSTERASSRLDRPPFPFDRSAALIFGCEADGHFSWSGSLLGCAVLGRFVSDEELHDPQKLLTDSSLVLTVSIPNSSMTATISSAATDLQIPERFVPYTRTVLLDPALYFTSTRLYMSDIALNIALFFPFGCLVAALSGRRGIGASKSILLAALAALLLSGSVEYAQAYLPGRFSSTADILSNTLGAILGSAFCIQERLMRPLVGWLRARARSGNHARAQSA
jgi:hypothetical protein